METPKSDLEKHIEEVSDMIEVPLKKQTKPHQEQETAGMRPVQAS